MEKEAEQRLGCGVAKESCICRPIRAAQSPQECRLRTAFPLPWTPTGSSRYAPPPSLSYGDTVNGNQDQTTNHGGLTDSGSVAQGPWSTSGLNHPQEVLQQGPQQLAQGSYPVQMPHSINNYLPQGLGMSYSQTPLLDLRIPEATPIHTPTPTKPPFSDNQSSCCHPGSEKQPAVTDFPGTQPIQFRPSHNGDYHDIRRPQCPDHVIGNSADRGAEMTIPSGGYTDSDFSGLNT